MEFENEIQKDETVLLGDTSISFRDKLILTNKRLIILKPKWFLSSTFIKRREIPLNEIIDARSAFMSRLRGNLMMILKLTTGEELPIKFDVGTASLLKTQKGMSFNVNVITEKWVNAINREIDKQINNNK